MPRHDNPAGRLCDLLDALKVTDRKAALIACWGQVLDLQGEALWLGIADVAGLLPAIQRAVASTGDRDQVEAVEHYLPLWSDAVLSSNGLSWDHPREDRPNVLALTTLRSISSFLSLSVPEGVQPPNETVADLIEQVHDAAVSVAALTEDDLPADVRALILKHLQKVEWALLHIRTGGPGAVKDALAALVGDIILNTDEEQRHRPGMAKVWATAGLAWMVFTGLSDVPPAIEAWGHVAQAVITAGPLS